MKKLLAFIISVIPAICNANLDSLDITVDHVSKYCSDNFIMLEFRFKNSSKKWVDVKTADLMFDSDEANETINIVVGSRLEYWQEAQQLKEREDNIKIGLFLGALGVAGQASDSNAGKIASLAAITRLTAKGLGTLQDKFRGNLVPRNHILNGMFTVPPELTLKRWVLLYSDNSSKNSFVKEIDLKLIDGNDNISKKLNIRDDDGGILPTCKWQASIIPEDLKPKCSDPWDRRCL